MSSDEVIALATDSFRGQLQSVLPAGTAVIVGTPSPEGQAVSGLFVQVLRIRVSKHRRILPPLDVGAYESIFRAQRAGEA